MDEDELTIEEALEELKLRGFENVTKEANTQNGPDYASKYAFLHPQGGIIYCDCDEDVFDIL